MTTAHRPTWKSAFGLADSIGKGYTPTRSYSARVHFYSYLGSSRLSETQRKTMGPGLCRLVTRKRFQSLTNQKITIGQTQNYWKWRVNS